MATSISSIENGIVFLMAPWSAPASMAWEQLSDYLAAHGAGVASLCINVDEAPAVYDLPELAGKIHGWGEVVVVRRGQVVFCTALGKDKKSVHARCEELLRADET